MILATWNDSYSVKVQQLDVQHKNFFEMINGLADAMRKEDTITLLYLLRDIILDHMLRVDLAYSAHFNANGIR